MSVRVFIAAIILLFPQLLRGHGVNLSLNLTDADRAWLRQHAGDIRYAPNPSWPPGDYIDEQGVHQGIVSDYIRIFEAELGVQFQRTYFRKWSEIDEALVTGASDFVGALHETPERGEYLAFTQVFMKVPLVLLVHSDYPATVDARSIPRMRLAAVKGYTSQQFVLQKYGDVEIVECEDDLAALLQTSLGRTDGTIIDLMTASHLVEKYGISNLSLAHEFDFIWELRFAVRKDYARLAEILDKLLSNISPEEHRAIFNKWVSLQQISKQGFLERNGRLLQVLGVITFVLLALILNYTILLRREVNRRTAQLNRELEEKQKAIRQSQLNEARLASLVEVSNIQSETSAVLISYLMREVLKLTDSRVGALYRCNSETGMLELEAYLDASGSTRPTQDIKSNCSIHALGESRARIRKGVEYTLDPCNECGKECRALCPLGNLHRDHTLVVPFWDESELDRVLFLADRQIPYTHEDAWQLILLMRSVRQLLNKQKWQEQLYAAKAKAEESDRLKSAFLANLSHEIRTPMNAILGFTSLMQEPDLTSDERDEYIGLITRASEYLLSVITDIVEMSKIDSGILRPNYSLVELRGIVRDVVHAASLSKLADKPLKLILQEPDESVDTSGMTDEVKLSQVIVNLLGNAIKYTDEGSVTLAYSIDANRELELRVRDTGPGIDPKYHEQIFKRFSQGDSDLAIRKGGTGLGLSICKAYVEMLGGTITVESEPGKGATFRFRIPLLQDRADPERKAAPAAPGTTLSRGDGRKVLVAEDDESNYSYIAQVLRSEGFEPIRASTGRQAVDLCDAHPDLSLVLMDIKMPEMNGYDAFRLIRQMRPELPVIAQTAYAMEEDEARIRDAGFDSFIPKPIRRNHLNELMNGILLPREG